MMQIRARHLNSVRAGTPARRRAFTLLEVLLALMVLAILMVAVHSVFYGAITLRNKTDAAYTDALPLQHTLAVIKRDVAGLAAPGGTFGGSLQTTPTTTSSSSLAHLGQQCGPTFHTTSGRLSTYEPWSEMRKVTYYLSPPTNSLPGYTLIRSVTRNLLPVAEDEYTDQTLMSGVNNLEFQFYDGASWLSYWDSTAASSAADSNSIPVGVKVQLTLINEAGVVDPYPIEMVISIAVQAVTNFTGSAGGNG